jgi:nucleotide-binding universal stress UspA family protein
MVLPIGTSFLTPTRVTPHIDMTSRVLVTLELPDPETIPPAIIETFPSMDVVVLGHYSVPEQTPPSAARSQFEEEAQSKLKEISRPLEDAGMSAKTRLVFSRGLNRTIDQVATEEGCDVILTTGQVESIDRLFVPLRGEENFDRILSFARELLSVNNASVTLFHTNEESDRRPGEELLGDATDRLVEAGIDPDRIDRKLASEQDTGKSIIEIGSGYDVMILGETEPSLRERIFGNVPAKVTSNTEDPAFVVRNSETEEP